MSHFYYRAAGSGSPSNYKLYGASENKFLRCRRDFIGFSSISQKDRKLRGIYFFPLIIITCVLHATNISTGENYETERLMSNRNSDG